MATSQHPSRVVVIGAGLSGLSAALWLRGAGCAVTVIEADAAPGGLVRTRTLGPGHRFDTGATVLTMPELVAAPMSAVGISAAETRRRLDLTQVDPTYVARFADGTSLRVPFGLDKLVAEVGATFGPSSGEDVRRLMAWLAELYDAEFDSFIDRNFAGPRSYLDRRLFTDLAQLIRLGGVRALTPAVARYVKDERLQRVFSFQALYAGVPPKRAAAVYGVIGHMDIGLGVQYPAGGMGRIGEVMADGLREAGAEVMMSTRAVEIVRRGGRVVAVRATDADGSPIEIPADAVVATTAVASVAQMLDGDLPRGPRWRHRRYSPSAVVIHGVMPRSVTEHWPGHHHTIDFGAAWHDTFTDLTARPGRLMRDPSFLITRPGCTDPQHFRSPRDGSGEMVESVSVLAPCPNLDVAPIAWDALADQYVEECLTTLAGRGYTDIDSALQILGVDHPGTWRAMGLPAGTPFSAAHSIAQTGPLRTPNRWPHQPDVVLAGAATIPGVGIPPVLVSGRLAAERLVGADAVGTALSAEGVAGHAR